MAHEHEQSGDAEACPARTLAIIDDHRTFADLLRIALSAEEDLTCVGVAYGIDEGLELVQRTRPDLVLIDLVFAGDERDGVVVTHQLRDLLPDTQVILLTGHPEPQLLHRAATAGASTLLTKDGSLPDLLAALRRATAGGTVMHPHLLRTMVDVSAPRATAADSPLSSREREVLSLMTVGMDARSIARQFEISVHTCRGHIRSILHKLDVHSQLEAVAEARRRGLLHDRRRA
jgi:two-component system nitrate/nitrite response regulator NarL